MTSNNNQGSEGVGLPIYSRQPVVRTFYTSSRTPNIIKQYKINSLSKESFKLSQQWNRFRNGADNVVMAKMDRLNQQRNNIITSLKRPKAVTITNPSYINNNNKNSSDE